MRALCNTLESPRDFPTICRPTGNPSALNSAGTDIAGHAMNDAQQAEPAIAETPPSIVPARRLAPLPPARRSSCAGHRDVDSADLDCMTHPVPAALLPNRVAGLG